MVVKDFAWAVESAPICKVVNVANLSLVRAAICEVAMPIKLAVEILVSWSELKEITCAVVKLFNCVDVSDATWSVVKLTTCAVDNDAICADVMEATSDGSRDVIWVVDMAPICAFVKLCNCVAVSPNNWSVVREAI